MTHYTIATVKRSVQLLCVAGVALLAPFGSALAHPGSGILVDRNGNVYFVVLGSSSIMRLGPDRKLVEFVTDERLRYPHHLIAGRDGTIYVASDHDGRVWRVAPDGRLHEHLNSDRARRPEGVSWHIQVGSGGDPFTVDSLGDVYAITTARSIVRIRTDGSTTPVATNTRFGDLHFSSMSWGGDGALYLTDANRVWRIVGDSAAPIVPRGSDLSAADGVAIDPAGNIYVADYRTGVVRFDRSGAVNTPPAVARLRARNPTGVTLAGNDVYVLDNPPGGVAIWRVRGDRAERLYSNMSFRAYAGYLFVGGLVLLGVLVVLNSVLKARARQRSGGALSGDLR
jgi:sugar lactone lactonase YvrE